MKHKAKFYRIHGLRYLYTPADEMCVSVSRVTGMSANVQPDII